MAGELILDTGALVSILDRSQADHEKCSRFFEAWERPILSTEAVLTEATHLLGRIHHGRKACVEFFLDGGAVLVPTTASSLRRVRELLEDYADLPMDYADATLVVLAEEIGTDLVFTTDRRDFGVYRIRARKRFRIVPE
jgi:predicted nucleic acid-binding protein